MEDYVCADDYRPLLPDGVYEAQCNKYDSKFCLGKTRKLFLTFRITEMGEYHGSEIFMAFNMPYDRKIKTGSKYYKTWVMVNDLQKPSRNTLMSARIFKNKIFRIKTRTTKPEHNGKEMPKDFWYSVVDKILEVIAG